MNKTIRKAVLGLQSSIVGDGKESALEVGKVELRGKRQQLSYWLHLGLGHHLKDRNGEDVHSIPNNIFENVDGNIVSLNVAMPDTDRLSDEKIVQDAQRFILMGRYLEMRSSLCKQETNSYIFASMTHN